MRLCAADKHLAFVRRGAYNLFWKCLQSHTAGHIRAEQQNGRRLQGRAASACMYSQRSTPMPAGPGGQAAGSIGRQLLSLITCGACAGTSQYEIPLDQPSDPPVQSLAQSLIPTSIFDVSAHPSIDDEANTTLLNSQPWTENGHRDAFGQHSRVEADAKHSTSPTAAGRGRGRLKPGGGHKRSKSTDQGIELKEAASNPLLGQYHMHGDHTFVKAKLQATAGSRHSSPPVDAA